MKNPPTPENPATTADAPSIARMVGLRHVDDSRPGITRKPARDGFRYLLADGAPLRDEAHLARIRALAIPPAWTEVWICPLANGHIQATGRDAKGRKQYRYHAQWRSVRDEAKYSRMLAFGRALPDIRRKVEEALALPGLPREKVLATVVRLLETTMIRVGNAEYARANKSFGLTTLKNRHVEVAGRAVAFRFRGKSGVMHDIRLQDARVARIVRRLRDLPGQEVFQYLDEDGQTHCIDSADVNDYLREISGEDYTAKDFRTWAGTMLAARELRALEACASETEGKRQIVQAIATVARRLGNTPAVCRKCYVHPAVLDSYLSGALHAAAANLLRAQAANDAHALDEEELAVLALLEAQANKAA